jgi:prolipoprotein diacylglyceryl transferase
VILASIPSPEQGVWELGPLPVRAYALCIIAGIVVCCWISEKRWVARGGAPGDVLDIAVWAVPFGIAGGRVYHVLTTPEPYFGEAGDPLKAFAIWEGGLGIWGAIALGGVGAWIACRRRKIPLPAFADAVAPGILVAQAIGRLGNWFNQELYGSPTDLPWALEIDPEHRVAGYLDVATYHPTFLYELLWNLAAAAVVVWADRRFRLGHGRAFALYVALYCLGRGWIEMLRIDTAEHFFGLRLNVFTSIIVGLLAVAYLVSQRGRPREVITRGATKATVGRGRPAAAGADADGAGGGSAGPAAPVRGRAADQRKQAESPRDSPG